tara:strand:+ start:1096 stop:1452 length:357 start_codon:yes stop_codon:yes gene_type:complete
MADIQKLTVQESLNAMGPGGIWDRFPAYTYVGTTSPQTKHEDVTNYHQLGIIATDKVYFNFHAGMDDVVPADDLSIEADTLVFLTVPRGLHKPDSELPNKIHFNHLGDSTCTIKIVGI